VNKNEWSNEYQRAATNDTIFEAPIYSSPRTITTVSGGTHPCLGTNGGANPIAGNTPTAAVDVASKLAKFTYDGSCDPGPGAEDYFIRDISTTTEDATPEVFATLVNYQFTPHARLDCQVEGKQGDDMLWGFNGYNAVHFLQVTPSTLLGGGDDSDGQCDGWEDGCTLCWSFHRWVYDE